MGLGRDNGHLKGTGMTRHAAQLGEKRVGREEPRSPLHVQYSCYKPPKIQKLHKSCKTPTLRKRGQRPTPATQSVGAQRVRAPDIPRGGVVRSVMLRVSRSLCAGHENPTSARAASQGSTIRVATHGVHSYTLPRGASAHAEILQTISPMSCR